MTFEDIDLSMYPASRKFSEIVHKQFYLWESYRPTTIEADLPFEQDWWKYVYWMPKIKKEFYLAAITSGDFNQALVDLGKKYGMDFWWFSIHYKDFIKVLEWMRKNNNVNHIGETK